MYSRGLQDATLLLSVNREKIALMTRLCFPRMKNVKTFKFLWHFLIIFWHVNPDFAFLLNSILCWCQRSSIFIDEQFLEAFDSAFSLVIVANVVFFLGFLFCNSFFVIHCHFAYPFLRFYSHVYCSVIALYRIKSNKLACIFFLIDNSWLF